MGSEWTRFAASEAQFVEPSLALAPTEMRGIAPGKVVREQSAVPKMLLVAQPARQRAHAFQRNGQHRSL